MPSVERVVDAVAQAARRSRWRSTSSRSSGGPPRPLLARARAGARRRPRRLGALLGPNARLGRRARTSRSSPARPGLDTGHALAGPIAVRGARAGADARRARSTRSSPRRVGRHVRRARTTTVRLGARGRGRAGARARSSTLAPFLGVLGMPPPEPGVHSTSPPRRWGGNIDCKELVAGTTLFLPIPVDGALFSAGDGHARQGDGEVSGTAIECPVEAQADARSFGTTSSSSGRSRGSTAPGSTFGFDEDLGARPRERGRRDARR